ncbi:MAG: hypothetical protein ABI151_15975 [Chitinophagaceae bacterium]
MKEAIYDPVKNQSYSSFRSNISVFTSRVLSSLFHFSIHGFTPG